METVREKEYLRVRFEDGAVVCVMLGYDGKYVWSAPDRPTSGCADKDGVRFAMAGSFRTHAAKLLEYAAELEQGE
jgi:hypothetical protein